MSVVSVSNVHLNTAGSTRFETIDNGANVRIVIESANVIQMNARGANAVKFANEGNSSDANTLDFYNEVTFSPNVTFSGNNAGMTYSWRFGRSTRIGRFVIVNIDIGLTSKGSSTGHFKITNLPIPCASDLNFTGGAVAEFGNAANLVGPVVCRVGSAANTTIDFYQTISNGATVTCNNTNFGNTTYFRTAVMYVSNT